MKTVANYELHYDALSCKFQYAYTTFRGSCDLLISPLQISSQEKEELIEHPGSARWSDPHLHLQLEKRLGLRYNGYIKATQILQTKLDKLKRRLKLSDDYQVSCPIIAYDIAKDQPSWITKSGSQLLEDKTKRAAFFNQKDLYKMYRLWRCETIIEDIILETERIHGFVKIAVGLEATRQERKVHIDSTHWLTVRDHAQRIFESLESRLSLPCSCKHSHRASLQLHTMNDISQSDFQAKCILSLEQKPGQTAVAPWKWRDIDIKPECIDRYVPNRVCIANIGKSL